MDRLGCPRPLGQHPEAQTEKEGAGLRDYEYQEFGLNLEGPGKLLRFAYGRKTVSLNVCGGLAPASLRILKSKDAPYRKRQRDFPAGRAVRICLPMQKTQVPSLVREDSTCPGAIKPVYHKY